MLNSRLPLSCFNVYAFTETWLSKNVNNSELGLKEYNIFRCDRNTHNSNLTRGGGVLIAVDNKLPSRYINISDNTLEIVIVLIQFDHKTVIISSIYIPNKSSLEVYSKYFKVINDIYYNYTNSDFI